MKDTKQRVKNHGFKTPFHPQQILSYLAAFFLTGSAYYSAWLLISIQDSTVNLVTIIFTALYTITGILVVYETARVTASDPSDPTVALERASEKKENGFRQQDYEFYCDICTTHVLEGSKHCRVCNRCTMGFDHHCRWVNNDIGLSNYREFISMLLSVILQLTIHAAYMVFAATLLEGPGRWLAVANLIVNVSFALPVGYLFGFHAWLAWQGHTTYSYIREKEGMGDSKIVHRVSTACADTDNKLRPTSLLHSVVKLLKRGRVEQV